MLAPKQPLPDEAATSLANMFERFTESSRKLETKYAGLTREVEELKAQLARKEEEIKRSERLAMLGETAAALAHEVRNPLGAITLFLSMLKTDVEDRPQAVGLVDEIERSITSLNNVVSNVLHFAKNNKPVFVPVNLHAIVNETVQHFSSLYAPNATIIASVSGNPFVLGDEHGLRQILYNLVINALQAGQLKGRITISVCDNTADSGEVCLKVADNGPGIAESVTERLFEPFVSGRNGGTGLGLSIVRRIVESHKGTIAATNDHGAVFTVRLPRRPAS